MYFFFYLRARDLYLLCFVQPRHGATFLQYRCFVTLAWVLPFPLDHLARMAAGFFFFRLVVFMFYSSQQGGGSLGLRFT